MVRRLFMALLIAVVMTTTTGCFGTFSLTRKVYGFNEKVGDKWIQSVVMWVLLIVPVYEVVGTIDLIFLNLLEFWTGENPVAINGDEVIEKIVRKDGELFRVEIGKGKVAVTGLNGNHRGKSAMLVFDHILSTCTLVSGSQRHRLCTVNKGPSSTIDLFYPDGRVRSFDADADVHLALSR